MPVRIESVQEVANRLAEALHDLQLGLDRHDTLLQHVLALLRHGKSGQPGVGLALDTLYRAFVDVVRQDGSRGESEAEAEFTRMVADAEHPLLNQIRQPMLKPKRPCVETAALGAASGSSRTFSGSRRCGGPAMKEPGGTARRGIHGLNNPNCGHPGAWAAYRPRRL